MTDTMYAHKFEDIDDIQNCTVFYYFDCFSDDYKAIASEEAFADIEFEDKYNIITDGSFEFNVERHILPLMRRRTDGLQFTHLNVYLVVDGIVECNIQLSTDTLYLPQILHFVQALIKSTDGKGICELTLDFSRPFFDDTTFTLKQNY